MNSKIIAYFVVGLTLCLATLFATGVLKIPGSSKGSNGTNKSSTLTSPSPTARDDATIQPAPFKTGYIKDSPQKLANQCKDDYAGVKNLPDFNNAKYPVNPVYVNYGGKPFPKDCKCTEFIRAP
jgi:hypothetical protein